MINKIIQGIGVLLLTPILFVWDRYTLRNIWEEFLEK